MYDFKQFDSQLEEIISWLEKELSAIRTGRATITLLDSVFVEAYGVKTPLNQVGSISQEDPSNRVAYCFVGQQALLDRKVIPRHCVDHRIALD